MAAILSSILITIACASAAEVNLSQKATKAGTLNAVVDTSFKSLQTPNLINSHFHTTILNLQQQMDLVEEDINTLHSHVRLSCGHCYSSFCLIPHSISNITSERHKLAQFIR